MLRKTLCLFVCLTFLGCYANALENIEDLLFMDLPVFSLSSGRAESIVKAASNAYVITGEEMKSRGYRTFIDLVNDLPGTVLFDTEGNAEKTLIARGNIWNSKYRIMVNGQSLNPRDGVQTIMQYNIPIDGVDKVEYIIGPYASMYGRNVYAGIINIITKRGVDINGGAVAIMNGNWDRKSTSVYAGSKIGGFDIYASLFNDSSLKGYDLRKEYPDYYSAGARQLPAGLPNEYYLPHDNKDLLLSIKHDSGLALDLEYNEVNSSKTGTDMYPTDYQSNDDTLETIKLADARVGYTAKVNSELESDSTLSYQKYSIYGKNRITYSAGGYSATDYYSIWAARATSYMLEQKFRYSPSDTNTLFAGLSYENVRSVPKKKGTLSYPVWADWELVNTNYVTYMIEDDFYLTNSLRTIAGFTYEQHTNILIPRLSEIWSIDEANTLKFLYGGGFKTPDTIFMVDQVKGSNNNIKGNPNLKPESITSYELQYIFNPNSDFKFDTSVFLNKEKHTILQDIKVVNDPYYAKTYANSKQDRTVYGIEANATGKVNNWIKLFASYGYVNGSQEQYEDTNDGPVGKMYDSLPGTVKHQFKVGMNMLLIEDKYNFYIHNIFKGPWVEFADNNFAKNNGYSLVDVNLSTTPKFNDKWSLSLGATNIFDLKAYDGPVLPDNTSSIPSPIRRRIITAQLTCNF
ncbi:MAG TPA: hypothetical protein DF296_06575 [Candidatus Margulisbacteria bacterium]|nr:MAG: hypothetical protein A2X42_01125 [Candidatus Margulisbacteria bacterium GWF2_38_17]OGI11118.1 MAG: hypothetical protein A2X41_02420 [Candidatus Margulisbacteria bacterium GWE2_39_32]HCT84848.1 hypothetical protein [Candidatus Margulisiibacteriota bacterium]